MSTSEKPGSSVDEVAGAAPKKSDLPTGVRRVNNMPLVIIGGVLVVFVALVALVAMQRGESKKPPPESTAAALPENSQLLDQMLASGAVGGLVPEADEAGTPSFAVARVDNPDLPPLPDRTEGAASAAAMDGLAQERMKLFQTAMHARTGLTTAALPAGPAKSHEDTDETTPATPTGEPDQRVPVHADGDYAVYDGTKRRARGEDRWRLDAAVEAPRSAFELRAGAVIPATMISGINSELPGQIVAQVSQDVFDTATGRQRLVPQGARLVGRYSHKVIEGQSRVLVAWQRIVFPDGKAMDIGAMEGADAGGYAGFQDKIDRHYLRMFGSAILMSGITAGLTSSRIRPDEDPYGSSNAAQLSQSLAQQIGDVASQMIRKNMNYAPNLQIRPGYRFNVMAVKDLTFDHAYRAFDY